MIIQRLTKIIPPQIKEINELIRQLSSHPKFVLPDDISAILKQPELYFFVAQDDSLKNQPIIGMASIIIYQIPTGKKGYIEDVVVDEKYRGLGLGQQLTQKLIGIAREKNAQYIDLTSGLSRLAANKLYQKMGFERRETNVYRLKL